MGTRGGFRVELGTFGVQRLMVNPFNSTVVGIPEPNSDISRKGFLFDGKSMVLAGDEDLSRQFIPDGMVDPMVAELHFIGLCPEG